MSWIPLDEGDGRVTTAGAAPPLGPSTRIGRIVPGLTAIRTYQRRWLRDDVVAGLVLAAILVPQGMAYAELAGLPAVTGLYTTIACLVGYALMGLFSLFAAYVLHALWRRCVAVEPLSERA